MYSDVVLRQTNKYTKSLNSTSDSKEQIFIAAFIQIRQLQRKTSQFD